MNVRDLNIIHANLLTSMKGGQSYDAYAWTRLLCRQLRTLTNKNQVTGTQEWQRVA